MQDLRGDQQLILLSVSNIACYSSINSYTCLKSSVIWRHEQKLTLNINMRIHLHNDVTDHQKSILTDSDWKKLWMAGGVNPDSKLDNNNLDSSDSPMFEDSEMMAHNTTVQLGGTAFLICKVSGVDRVGVNWNQISWIRRRDWHILSSGAQLYTNDERFAILHAPGSNTWTLQIKFVQRRDHGMYECQHTERWKKKTNSVDVWRVKELVKCTFTPRELAIQNFFYSGTRGI
ncbi:uncharacterized protein LOC129950706 [Eupeodes corollae]|uniref:uncharacterized protein LOC129950706 n=1 Tax=Eupeodes corollae TaxID=290404 RepID=UPI002492D9B3|nr:uncharacterized protein LOC129950706 [Eupeodes corollae]